MSSVAPEASETLVARLFPEVSVPVPSVLAMLLTVSVLLLPPKPLIVMLSPTSNSELIVVEADGNAALPVTSTLLAATPAASVV